MPKAVDSDASYRVRLEGRAERLEAARLRLTALKLMLNAFRWRDRLRRNTALLRETAADQAAVEEALAVVARRAKAEGWSADAEVLSCAQAVEQLSNQVAALAFKRLGAQSRAEDLAQRLERLEFVVLSAPRLVLPGQRWSTAQEVLPLGHPDVRRAGAFAAFLEPLFKRPMGPSQRLPFTPAELDALSEQWPQGQRALRAAWTRVARIDAAGTLTRFLRRRSSRTPMHTPKNGPELVLAAEFWSSFATARLKEVAAARIAPVNCGEDELFEVVRWLACRETDAEARLAASATLSDGRAGLIELAHELSSIPPRLEQGAVRGEQWWARLAERAARGERAAAESDYQKIQDNLRLFLRVLQRPDTTPPVYRALATLPHARAQGEPVAQTLGGLVEAMRTKMS